MRPPSVTEGEAGLGQKLTDPRYHQPYGGAYWQVSENGRPIVRSRSLWDQDLPPGGARPGAEREKAFEVEGPDGSELYVIEREVTVDGDQGPRTVSLAVALDHAQVVELRQAFGWDVTRVLIPIAAVLVLFAWIAALAGPASAAGRRSRSECGTDRPDPAHDQALSGRGRAAGREHQQAARSPGKPRAQGARPGRRIGARLEDTFDDSRRARCGTWSNAGQHQAAERMQEQLGRSAPMWSARSRGHAPAAHRSACGAYTAGGRDRRPPPAPDAAHAQGRALVWQTRDPGRPRRRYGSARFRRGHGQSPRQCQEMGQSPGHHPCRHAPEKARIVVEDDGPGFSEHRRRGPERGITGTSDPTSSGLGLGIVEDILAEYGTGAEIDGNGHCSDLIRDPACRAIPLAANKAATEPAAHAAES